MATITFGAVNGNWTDGTKWVGGSAPTAADDALLTATSANPTINSGAVCRSLNCTGFTGTLSHNSFVTFNIGDGTAGLTSVALTMVAGMAYSKSSATTSAITFKSTSATQQTITTGGKTLGNVVINGAGSSYQTTDDLTSSGNFTYTAGTTFDTTTNSNKIILNGNGSAFAGAGMTYFELDLTGLAVATITGANTFTNLKRVGTNIKTDSLRLSNNQTLTGSGTLTLTGNSSTNRLLVQGTTLGTQQTITNGASTITWSNVDFQDIGLGTTVNVSGQTDIGDCGGNSGITFPASATQTWSGTSGGNWSTNAWTSRVPLPQDNVTINAAFSASQTVTNDMPRLGQSITWTGATGSPTWSFGSIANSIFGSITLISAMTVSGGNITTLAGRSSYTLTSNTNTFPQGLTINAPTGTYTMNDALITSGDLTCSFGTFSTGGLQLNCLTLVSTSGNTRTLTITNSTVNLTSTAAASIVNMVSTSLTFNSSGSTLVVLNTSSNTRTFTGGGLTFGTLTYTVAGSTGQLNLSGSNTFDTINFSDSSNARSLLFTAATTTTINTTFNVNGTATKLMTIGSVTAAGHTLSKASGTVSCDYLSISRSTATGGAGWYAGANSTDGGNNSGWIFTAPPATTTIGGTLLLLGV